MKRVYIFEFEDAPWFPSFLRNSMTDLLIVLNRTFGATESLTAFIRELNKQHNFTQIVDLGSGSGGAMPEVVETLTEEAPGENISLLMTDLYPNQEAIDLYNSQNNPNIHYKTTAVNACDLTNAPKGLKTMVNSFHHLSPTEAQSVLHSAQKNKDCLLIYELADNKIPFPVLCIFLPFGLFINIIFALVLSPFVRQVTITQLVFTYIIPIIPLCFAWDGQASYARIYTFQDIDLLLEGCEDEHYRWEKGYLKDRLGNGIGTYVLGLPTSTIEE